MSGGRPEESPAIQIDWKVQHKHTVTHTLTHVRAQALYRLLFRAVKKLVLPLRLWYCPVCVDVCGCVVKVPMASVSGLAVASLQLLNEKYRPYKGRHTSITIIAPSFIPQLTCHGSCVLLCGRGEDGHKIGQVPGPHGLSKRPNTGQLVRVWARQAQ